MAVPEPAPPSLPGLVGASRGPGAAEPQPTGSALGRYRVVRRLARGGMADVYLATQLGPTGEERTVVIKRLRPELRRDPEFGRMFQDEVQIAVRLDHPNVVKVVEPLVAGSETLLVLEWVQGRSLSSVLNRARKRDRPLEPAVVAAIGAQVAAGLQHAHELRDADGNRMGVIHRDVSPQNIMIGIDGVAKVLDFGVAWVLGRMSRTRVGVAKGKLGYMAPEQLEHRVIDQRTDVFAMGVVLWEALAGRRLFPLDKDGVAIRSAATEDIQAPSVYRAIPPELERIVMRALERESIRRPRNAAELSAELAAFADAHGAGPATIAATIAGLFDGTQTTRERVNTSATVAIRQPGAPTREEVAARTPAAYTPGPTPGLTPGPTPGPTPGLTPAALVPGMYTPQAPTPLPPPSAPRAGGAMSSGVHTPPPGSGSLTTSSPSLPSLQSLLASQTSPSSVHHTGSSPGRTRSGSYDALSDVSRTRSQVTAVPSTGLLGKFWWGVVAGCAVSIALMIGLSRLQPALVRPLLGDGDSARASASAGGRAPGDTANAPSAAAGAIIQPVTPLPAPGGKVPQPTAPAGVVAPLAPGASTTVAPTEATAAAPFGGTPATSPGSAPAGTEGGTANDKAAPSSSATSPATAGDAKSTTTRRPAAPARKPVKTKRATSRTRR